MNLAKGFLILGFFALGGSAFAAGTEDVFIIGSTDSEETQVLKITGFEHSIKIEMCEKNNSDHCSKEMFGRTLPKSTLIYDLATVVRERNSTPLWKRITIYVVATLAGAATTWEMVSCTESMKSQLMRFGLSFSVGAAVAVIATEVIYFLLVNDKLEKADFEMTSILRAIESLANDPSPNSSERTELNLDHWDVEEIWDVFAEAGIFKDASLVH